MYGDMEWTGDWRSEIPRLLNYAKPGGLVKNIRVCARILVFNVHTKPTKLKLPIASFLR